MSERRWFAVKNDLVGGWAVSSYHYPLSQHDSRPDGDPSKRGYVIAECMTYTDAGCIAALLNAAHVTVPKGEWVGAALDPEEDSDGDHD